MYTPVYPFYYIKMGFKGVYISRTCYPDDMFIIERLVVALHSSTLSLELFQHNSKAVLYIVQNCILCHISIFVLFHFSSIQNILFHLIKLIK